MSSVRDNQLLDKLEALPQQAFSGKVWRSVREGREPGVCSKSGGRWDDRTFEVLYTSTEREGAIEERRFHLFKGQPFPPSKIRYALFRFHVEVSSVISLESLSALENLGLRTDNFGSLNYFEREQEYPRSQDIAEACFFLGAGGILVPSARHDSSNLVIFCGKTDPPPEIHDPELSEVINWAEV